MKVVYILFLSIQIFINSDGYLMPRYKKLNQLNYQVNMISNKNNFINKYYSSNSLILYEKSIDNEINFDKSYDSILNISKLYSRSSWISWWIQIILSVISGVILTFANTVRQSDSRNIAYLWGSGFAFSSIGVLLAFINSLWTWNITLLTRRIVFKKIQGKNAIASLKKYSRISVAISLLGMLFSLIGAEQIVGTLASKILSSSGFSPVFTANVSPFQAVDIFLVQANTNALVSHFASLTCYILLQTQLPNMINSVITSKDMITKKDVDDSTMNIEVK